GLATDQCVRHAVFLERPRNAAQALRDLVHRHEVLLPQTRGCRGRAHFSSKTSFTSMRLKPRTSCIPRHANKTESVTTKSKTLRKSGWRLRAPSGRYGSSPAPAPIRPPRTPQRKACSSQCHAISNSKPTHQRKRNAKGMDNK